MKFSKAIVPSVIPFQTAELLLVDYKGDPFVPMKPLVEGMGLNWKTQRPKLAASRFALLITKIAVITATGKHRSMVCLPLRKLVGWLMTISVESIRPNLQACVHAYQQDCDDVLWRHWHLGRPQLTCPELGSNHATALAGEYLAKYRDAIVTAGGTLPKLGVAAEDRIATGLAMLLLRDKRWLVTFDGRGDPQLMSVPVDAGIFTPDKILSWIRERDGASLSFLPDLVYALGDRMKNAVQAET